MHGRVAVALPSLDADDARSTQHGLQLAPVVGRLVEVVGVDLAAHEYGLDRQLFAVFGTIPGNHLVQVWNA